MEPHTKKISSRNFELDIGAHLWHWALCALGSVFAGGAQIMCIFELAPMLACTYYHYKAEAKSSVITNCVFMLALAGCGFMPPPMVPSMPERTPAFWGLAVVCLLTLLASLIYLSGKTEDIYKMGPPARKEMMSREGELLMGSCLLGSFVGMLSSLITGGAKFTCLLFLPAAFVTGLAHWIGIKDKFDAILNWVVMAILFCLGLLS